MIRNTVVRESENLTFDDMTIQDLMTSVQGTVIQRDDASYEEECRSYDMINGGPWMIVKCQHATDVTEALKFGAIHKLRITVHGSVHHAGPGACDDGLLLDVTQVTELSSVLENNNV